MFPTGYVHAESPWYPLYFAPISILMISPSLSLRFLEFRVQALHLQKHICSPKSVVSFKRWRSTIFLNRLFRYLIELFRCNSRSNVLFQLLMSQSNDPASFSHDFYLARSFADYHYAKPPMRTSISANTLLISCSPLMLCK